MECTVSKISTPIAPNLHPTFLLGKMRFSVGENKVLGQPILDKLSVCELGSDEVQPVYGVFQVC